MSELKAKLHQMIEGAMQQRPSTTTGVLIDFDHETGLATVEALSPTSPGLMKFSDLAIPGGIAHLFGPGPPLGSQVNLIFPGGNPHLAQIVAIKSPDQTRQAERLALSRPRTFLPAITGPAL